MYLLKSSNNNNAVSVVAKDGSDIDCITTQQQQQPSLFVGDISRLAALNGIDVDPPPAVVLGVEVLRLRPRILYRGQQKNYTFNLLKYNFKRSLQFLLGCCCFYCITMPDRSVDDVSKLMGC